MKKKLTLNEQSILNNFHTILENLKDFRGLYSLFPNFYEFSENLRNYFIVEYQSLLILDKNQIDKNFLALDFIKPYIEERLLQTENIYLIAKYYHFLYYLTKNNNYVKHAIDNYLIFIFNYFEQPLITQLEPIYQNVLETIFKLSKSIKYKELEIINRIHVFLKNQPEDKKRIKTKIIQSILKENYFKKQDLEYIPKLCCEIAQNETIYGYIEHNLQLALKASQKTQNNEMIRRINELLGDNEYSIVSDATKDPDNIIIPHQNCSILRKIIEYYTISKNTIKIEKALKDYDINKNICKYIELSIPLHSFQNSEFDKLQFENYKHLIQLPTNKIIFHFILGGKLFCINSVTLEHLASINENYLHNIFFQHIISDINNNESQISSVEIQKRFIYLNALNETIYLVHFIFLMCIKNKKLSYTKFKTFLNSDLFFGEILVCKNHNRETSYNWFSLIDIGLKSFFDQYNLLLKNKEPDWRFTIDFLTLKFEGILRDILMLLGDSTTKLKDGNTSEILLDNLLRNEKLKSCFNQDDLNLFIYTFTNKGLNIRNNVAHSFYKPVDYTFDKAIVLLLCILRLAKFKIVINSKQITL